jgi:uncharacterized protein YjbI with pentapeptide repeats
MVDVVAPGCVLPSASAQIGIGRRRPKRFRRMGERAGRKTSRRSIEETRRMTIAGARSIDSPDRIRARFGGTALDAVALPLSRVFFFFLFLLAVGLLLAPTQALAVSTLPCPSVGAQPQSTPSLGAGQDNACEFWSNAPQQLAGANVSGANLSRAALWIVGGGANFTGTDFSGASMAGFFASDFSAANLTNANLQNVFAEQVFFDDAIMTGATLTGGNFSRGGLRRTNLSGKDMRGTGLFRTRLDDTNLSSANLSGVLVGGGPGTPYFASRVNFSSATMVGSSVYGTFTDSNFVSTNLTQAIFWVNAQDGDFTGAFFFQAQVRGLFTRGSLRNAVLVDADLSNTDFRGTDLTNAVTGPGTNLSSVAYDAATIFPSGNTFVGPTWGLFGGLSPLDLGMIARFVGADFSGRNFTNVDFMNANMDSTINLGTVYTNADLSSCNLRFARLEGAILTGANLTAATLTSATYDPATIFPSGNDYASPPWGLPGGLAPWQMGMIPVPEPTGSAVSLGAIAGLVAAARARRRCSNRSSRSSAGPSLRPGDVAAS